MIALLLATVLLADVPPELPEGMVVPAQLERCVACHGIDGRSRTPVAPHIGGQNEAYLVWALNQYREGRREGDVMDHVSVVLSRKDIEALAHWYARQRWPAQAVEP